MPPRQPTPPPRPRRRAGQDKPVLPAQVCPLPDTPPRKRPMWRQLGLAVILSLAGLVGTSVLVDHCARDARFCTLPIQHTGGVTPSLPLPAPAAPAPETTRPVMAHAFEPLPLSLDGENTRNYVLPPGLSMLDMATQAGRIDVGDVSLIAVVQQDGVRHALVRLPDGRILRLQQGDALEGGTVAAISEDAIYLIGPDRVPRALILGG